MTLTGCNYQDILKRAKSPHFKIQEPLYFKIEKGFPYHHKNKLLTMFCI